MDSKVGYAAVDQTGMTILLTHPTRTAKEQLKDYLGVARCNPYYVRIDDEIPRLVGYRVGWREFRIFELHEWEQT